MPFLSYTFVAFFTIVACVNFMLPRAWRWAWLLAASLVFYGWGSPAFVLQLIAATGVAFYAGLKMDAAPDKPAKQKIMTVAVVALLLNLLVFKYTGFFNESFRGLFSAVGLTYPVPVLDLPLPLGVSFYTFLLVGYVVDVFRGTKAEKNFGIFALFSAFFPKVVSGPIERGKQLLPQLNNPPAFDPATFAWGLQLILWGVFKKAVVADRIGPLVADAYSNPAGYDGVVLTATTWLYAFQIYCDFSGYTDIALGVAAVLGYKLMNNFNRPYFATSIQDFWKRWHISLTSWLTDYIFTPLSRQKIIKVKFFTMMLWGMFITFVLSGLWHGAAWTYVIWGTLHGLYLVAFLWLQKPWNGYARKIGLLKRPKLYRGLKIGFVFILVCYAYVWFRAESVADAWYITTHLLTGWGGALGSLQAYFGDRVVVTLISLLGIGVVMISDFVWGNGFNAKAVAAWRPTWLRWGMMYAAAASIVLLGAFYGGAQQFIYFRF